MFRYAIRYLAVVSALAVTVSAEQPPAPAAATEVERIERELVAAISANDLATYDRLVADDYVVVAADGRESTKKEVMDVYRTGSRAYRNLQIDQRQGPCGPETPPS